MHRLHDAVSALIMKVADSVVLPRFRNLTADQVSDKAADDLVTIADTESEERLAEGLSAIFGDARIIGEEACAADPSLLDRAGEGLIWLIDPIDGTNNFAAGRAPFGIMIALVEDGVIEAGWIFDPLTRRMCHAERGCGAWIDGEPLVARSSSSELPIAAIATYFLSEEQRADIAARAEGRLVVVDIPRCAAEQYPRLALGQNDVALFERSHPWDHAAGALLLNEAGGKLTRRDGSAYRIGDRRTGLLGAASPRLWDEAAAILFA